MVDLRTLEVFFWVVKLGGFGKAAERLHMTQPGVSQRISQLETRFKVRLLDRSSHRTPIPTAKGVEFYAYAERMLSLHSELMSCLSEKVGLSGTVRLGVAETLVHTILGALIRLLHDLHPRLTPEVAVDISPNLRASLLAGELDVALLLGPLNEPRVRNVPLGEHEMVWVAGNELDLGPGPLDMRDLASWPILSYARGTLPHAQIAELFSRADLHSPRIFANSSIASILRMALDNIGVGVLPYAVVARDLAAGKLRRLDVTQTISSLNFTASYVATPGDGVAHTVAELAARVSRET